MILANDIIIADSDYARNQGYIAGTGAGIVSVAGAGAVRTVYVFDIAKNLALVRRAYSTAAGNYLVRYLNPNKQYLIIARDYKREYEPVAYDYVTPATDLTPQQQLELWQSW